MTDKGVTIERSPSSGLSVGVFSPHLGGGGGGGGAWDGSAGNAIITKISPTAPPAPRRPHNIDNNQERERRRRRSGDKTLLKVGRACGCGGWARAGQLEHDLAELKTTHENLLVGLHQQVESLKQKNRDLTFQVLMGPYAGAVKTNIPLSPESDEATSPKNESSKKSEDTKKEPKTAAPSTATAAPSTATAAPSTATADTSAANASTPTAAITGVAVSHDARDATKDKSAKDESNMQALPQTQQVAEELQNGDVGRVVRRPFPGRSGRGDPRQVRSLDLELLEEETHHTRRLLDEERAKNKYLTTLIDDLKRQAREAATEATPEPSHSTVGAKTGPPPLLPPPRPPPRPPRTAPTPRLATHTSPPHARQVERGLGSNTSPQRGRGPRESPGRGGDREPRFPPLRHTYHEPRRHSPAQRNARSGERQGTTLPAITQGAGGQEQQAQQPRGRGRHNGRGRVRQRQQQHQDTTTDSEVSDPQPRGRRPTSMTRGSARHHHQQDARAAQDGTGPSSAPPRDHSPGRRGDAGAAGPSAYNDKPGSASHDHDTGRPETRSKGRGRAHRRGGRGRPRREKQTPPTAEHTENEP